jgi:hypothetical protein
LLFFVVATVLLTGRREGVTWGSSEKVAYFILDPELPQLPSSLDPQTTRGLTTIPATRPGAFPTGFGISCSGKLFFCN